MKKVVSGRNAGIGIGIIVVVVIIILLTNPLSNKGNESDDSNVLSKETFTYIGNEVLDKETIKSQCVYIRVGRCDAIGGVFGEDCFFRPAEFKYQLNGVSPSSITCTAKNKDGKDLETSGTLNPTSESNVYTLNVKVDVRQNNAVSICCNKNTEQLCFDVADTEGIC